MKSNIVLIGFMGTGKSTIGRKLARKLKLSYLDTDEEIERVTGMTIPGIFAKYGEIRFRSEEKLAVKKAARQKNCVISTGGGMVLAPENIALLKEDGILICLTATPEVVFDRVKKSTRPLLQKIATAEQIAALMRERASLYRCADYYIDTSGEGSDSIVERIVNFLQERGLLWTK